MNYILYYKIKEQLIKDYKYLNGGATTPDISFDKNKTLDKKSINIEKYIQGEMLQYLDETNKIINTIQKSSKIDELQTYINIYKDRIKEIIEKVNIYLPKAKEYNSKFAPDVLVNFFTKQNKFTDLVNNYNNKISQASWTGERINKEIYDSNTQTNPELIDELFLDNINTFDKFNNELLLLFTPFLTSYDAMVNLPDEEKKRKLNENLDKDIRNLEELIKLAEEYNKYINNKRQGVMSILNIIYKSEDVKTYDNSDKKIEKKNHFMEELKEAVVSKEAKLDYSAIRMISSSLTSVINALEINDEMKSIENFDIFDIDIDLKKELSLENIISYNTNSIRGGNTKTIITKETNKKLLTLLRLTEKLYLTLDTILNDSKYLQQVQIRYNFYLAYIFLIIKQSASKDVITVFKYLSLDIIQSYLSIFEKIKNKFSNLTEVDVNTIYLNKYHYLTIDKLINLFIFLKGKISSKDILIDISECNGNVLNDINLFNHFKSIIKSYVNTTEGQIVSELTIIDINNIWFDLLPSL